MKFKVSKSGALHLRNCNLNELDALEIADSPELKTNIINSISLSYNPNIGDQGIIGITKRLPSSISEIGLVNCGLGDSAGIEILDWIKSSQNLKMICIEQNNFSNSLKEEFHKFSKENPHILVVL